jgi:hypothetical protein
MTISFDTPAAASLLPLLPVAGPAWGEHNQSTDCAAVGVEVDPGTTSLSQQRPAPRNLLGLLTTLLLVLAVIVVREGDAKANRLLPHRQT